MCFHVEISVRFYGHITNMNRRAFTINMPAGQTAPLHRHLVIYHLTSKIRKFSLFFRSNLFLHTSYVFCAKE